MLQAFFIRNGLLNAFSLVKPDQLGHVIPSSKSIDRMLFVFMDTANQMDGDADIQSTVFLVGEHVDKVSHK